MMWMYERTEKRFKYLQGLIVPRINTTWVQPILNTKFKTYYIPVSQNVEDVDMILFSTKKFLGTKTKLYYQHFTPYYVALYSPKKITGTVTEKEVKNVSYTSVLLLNGSYNLVAKTTTNVDGTFNFSNVPPGTYTLVAPDYSVVGYNSVLLSGIIL